MNSESIRPESEEWTVQRVLTWTTGFLKKHNSETPRLDAEILLAHVRGSERITLYTEHNHLLSDQERAQMRELVKRRAAAEPVAYLVGHREFYSLEFEVTADVLIPRPDTETLVMEVLDLMEPLNAPRLIDAGTGSGCIAIAIASQHPTVEIVATDISQKALDVARRNAKKHSLDDRICFFQGDFLEPAISLGEFDVVVSNPPYVTEAEYAMLDADVRNHEPSLALIGGKEGIEFHRQLIETAPACLKSGGSLFLEIDPAQAMLLAPLIQSNPQYRNMLVLKDLSKTDRVIRAVKQ